MLATNDGVVGPLVEDGVAAFGADNEVVGRRRVEINLGKARGAINRETFDVVVNHSVEGSAPQTDSIGSVRSHNAVVPYRGALGVVDTDAFRQIGLYFSSVVPDRRLNPRVGGVIQKVEAVGILLGADELVVMNEVL